MKSVRPYLQEAKDEIISRYKKSGLSQKQFCERPDVPITTVTLRKWLKQAYAVVQQKASTSGMNIVCYNIGRQSGSSSEAKYREEPSLPDLITFQQQLYDLCLRLYRLPCDREGRTILSRITGFLR